MPVIFLPNDQDQSEVDENCEDTGDAQMSSFGLMSFAMAMVNAVINNANNVNNNNNNNNNNDNNNNNNDNNNVSTYYKHTFNKQTAIHRWITSKEFLRVLGLIKKSVVGSPMVMVAQYLVGFQTDALQV